MEAEIHKAYLILMVNFVATKKKFLLFYDVIENMISNHVYLFCIFKTN